MGPITGLRIVNLRVRDKVAYPDLTLDVASEGAEHLVVGLENGGGKSTLLGAIYHVFVPDADQFLPRRAQRRQHKEGELKKLEHYVPGGDPTHFIVEVECPTQDGVLPTFTGPRVLVGACLWKPAGSPPSAPASEFFWSARCVTPDLSLRELALRGPGGRLLDHREFRAKLKQLRTDVPAAQVNVEEGKGAWELHLRGLGIDVEYVRQFLLRMNEDEGAADQVFTYASSRSFLNSLVAVVGDPSAIEQLKQRLSDMARDADTMLLDRLRAALLGNLVAHTAPLAEAVRDLRERTRERDRMVDRVVATQRRLGQCLDDLQRASAAASARRAELDRSVIEARNAYSEAHARYVLARVQVARLRMEAAAAETRTAEREQDEARADERVARAAALLAERRTSEARARGVEELLARKVIEAEPLRRALSSAVQAMDLRLAADIERLEGERRGFLAAAARAAEDLCRAGEQRAAAASAVGALGGERKALVAERAALDLQLSRAVEAGVIRAPNVDVAVELQRARELVASEGTAAEAHEQRRRRASDALEELAKRDRQLTGDLVRVEEGIDRARSDLETVSRRTDALATSIAASGMVEIHPVVLDDHHGAIRERLEAVIEAARLKQAAAAVSGAAAERAAVWLRDHERLPPRPDVERLCDRARAERLGARPGWSYLATLRDDFAAACAEAHPGLADGIVVNVPEDLSKVVELVAAARDELDGPVLVGPASAFEGEAGGLGRASTVVVLPHTAYWSTTAGRELVGARTAEAERWRTEKDEATARGDAAVSLREQLASWTAEVGPGGHEQRRRHLERQLEHKRAITSERGDLALTIEERRADGASAEAARDAARERARDAALRAQRLETLTSVRGRIDAIEARLDVVDADESAATIDRDVATVAMTEAAARQEAASVRLQQLAADLAGLATERNELASLAAVAVLSGDVVEERDRAADRNLLAQHVRDRENRWRGAVTDPELRAELGTLQSAVRELEKRLREYTDVAEKARALLAEDPTRSADDYRTRAEQVRNTVEMLAGRIGELKATERQLKSELDKVQDEFRTLRRPAELGPDEAGAVDEAADVCERLRGRREAAMSLRAEREAEQLAAAQIEKITIARVELADAARRRLGTAAQRLVAGGVIVPPIDLAGRESHLDDGALLADSELPGPFAVVLRAAGARVEEEDPATALDADKAATAGSLDDIDAETEHLHAALAALESRATVALDAAEALLRDASEDVVAGDRIVQTLRAAPRRTLADLAATHHDDIVQRLEAVRHHVATFDARVDALADTVYASIADLLREVRRTVRESQLPNTPAMGRWAGADLLQLTGLDTLKVEQRRAAIAATLRGWFNPERPEDRPRNFDSNDVVDDLLRAVTPQFTARILIPSDPLDPEHKPVDHLALETSGGEGVTVALILASLLASRRASARGHRRTTLLLDNPFAKVTKPEFLRLARDVADELDVQLVAFTGIRDLGALTVFPRLTQLRVSRRENANFVVPYEIDDDRLQPLLRDGTLYVSPVEWAAAQRDGSGAWPLMSAVTVAARRSRGST